MIQEVTTEMKKRIFLMMMVGLMSTSVFMSGCGKTGNDVAVEDDEDDEDEDDEDEEDREDDENDQNDDGSDAPSVKPIVEMIDKDDLSDQIRILIDDRDYWTMSDADDDAVYRIGYCVTDLDLDGRIELIVSREYDYSNVSDSYVYEINEAGDDYGFVCLNLFNSTITDDVEPDFLSCDSADCYFDKENRELHYLLIDNFDNGNGNYGALLMDVNKSSENIYCNSYLTISVQENVDQENYESTYEYKYYEGNMEIKEADYYRIIDSYPEDVVTRPVYFGYLTRYSYQEMYLNDLDNAALEDALCDSYYVFAGSLDQIDFDHTYNITSDTLPDIDLSSLAIGDWELYSSEVEDSVTRYTPDSPFYKEMYVYDDSSVYFIDYEYGEIVRTFSSELNYQDFYPVFEYDIVEELGKPDELGAVLETYTLTDHYYENGAEFLEVTEDIYSDDGWLGYSILNFRRQ